MLAWFSRVLKGFEVFKCGPIDFLTIPTMIEAQRFGSNGVVELNMVVR